MSIVDGWYCDTLSTFGSRIDFKYIYEEVFNYNLQAAIIT